MFSRSSGSSPPRCDQARKAPSKMEVRCSNSPRRRDMLLFVGCPSPVAVVPAAAAAAAVVVVAVVAASLAAIRCHGVRRDVWRAL